MRYLLFLFWIPTLILLYLSIHQEVVTEKGHDVEKKPGITCAHWTSSLSDLEHESKAREHSLTVQVSARGVRN